MSHTIVESQQLVKQYGELRAVDHLSLSVQQGECFGLLGPNGAGKSTFIAMVYGLAKKTSGSLKVFGMDPFIESREVKKRLGVVTQENGLDEDLTVEENLLVYATFHSLPSRERKDRVHEMLAIMDLSNKAKTHIRALSGGMKRRLVFARALLGKPECLVLDEPTTGLDPALRHTLWNKVRLLKSQGTTVLLTTHYMHEAEALCDRVAILNRGKIVDLDTPRQLIVKHAPERVGIAPNVSRPGNLEDVFLELTDHEHDQAI